MVPQQKTVENAKTATSTKPKRKKVRISETVKADIVKATEQLDYAESEEQDREFDPANYQVFPPEFNPLTAGETEHIPTGLTDDDRPAKGQVRLSRWVVYVQAALLGVVAATFFLFGLMVGNFTSSGKTQPDNVIAARVTGKVFYQSGEQQYGDEGAVVLLLPVDRVPAERIDPTELSPKSFEALNNRARELIESVGGAVVRVEADGSYQASVKGPGKFWMLTISKSRSENQSHQLTKEQLANLGSYVYPLRNLTDGQAYQYREFTVSSSTRDIADVIF